MKRRITRSLYDEAFETYGRLRPCELGSRWVAYDLSDEDWNWFLHMGECHLEVQVTGATNEDGSVSRCRRLLKQLRRLQAAGA